MRILITGVAGLIGSRLAEYIINNHSEIEIIGIDDLSGGYIENVPNGVNFYKLNLVTDNIEEYFDGVDYVYHFAAYAAEGLSPFIRVFNYQNNLVTTARIVNSCVKFNIKRLIFTSSMAVYGHGNGKLFDETDIPNPIDPYGVAKYACEMDIQSAGHHHNLDWCIIRPHNVYGINQNIWDKYRNVLGIWMYQHLNNQPMTIFGDGEQIRSFSFVDDCLESLWKSSYQENCSKQIINLGGSQPYTINEANQILREIVGAGQTIYLESRKEVKTAIPTVAKSRKLLGYMDKTNLYDGLSQMWEWAKTQPKRHQFTWNSYEINKNIYTFWKI